MLIDKDTRQISMEFVSIEKLVLKYHLLRKIDKAIDFGFIREKVRNLYCATTVVLQLSRDSAVS